MHGVIVKMGGLNVTPIYVADMYVTHIESCVSAGMPKGHYWVPGKGMSPQDQAKFMAQNLHRLDKEHDVLMLDNEVLNANGIFWQQDDAVAFLTELHNLTGVPYDRIWHYAGAEPAAGGYRNRGPWDKLEALGVRIVWSAYGDIPASREPDHEPELRGHLTHWDVHQFTNRAPFYWNADNSVAMSGDGNFSREAWQTLFNY